MPTPEASLAPASKQAMVWAKYRELAPLHKTAAGMDHPLSHRLIGAAIGAGVGAPLGYLSSKADLASQKADIDRLKSEQKGGEGGFAKSMELAARSMRYHMSEAAVSNPLAATLAGAGMGALTGASAGPQAWQLAKKAPESIRKIHKAL